MAGRGGRGGVAGRTARAASQDWYRYAGIERGDIALFKRNRFEDKRDYSRSMAHLLPPSRCWAGGMGRRLRTASLTGCVWRNGRPVRLLVLRRSLSGMKRLSTLVSKLPSAMY